MHAGAALLSFLALFVFRLHGFRFEWSPDKA